MVARSGITVFWDSLKMQIECVLVAVVVDQFGQRCSGIIWLMTAEFPYLITNRICAPLELCAEESDEWQGKTQRPKQRRQERE